MLRTLSAFILLGLIPAAALAQNVVELHAVKDNTLYEDAGGNFSNGSGDHIFAGTTERDNLMRRALIAFDLGGALPEGAVVDSVQVELNMNRSLGTQHFVHLHRVTRDWGEGSSNPVGQEGGGTNAADGDATWIHAVRPGTTWTSPGGDFRSSNSGEISILNQGPAIWYNTASLQADVTDWLADPSVNFGWLVMGDELTNGTAQRFASRENPDMNVRPTLRIYYSETATFTESEDQPHSWTLAASWPNPFTTTTNIPLTSETTGQIRIDVFDVRGRTILRRIQSVLPGYQEVTLDGSTWAPGLYFIRVSENGASESRTVLKTK